LVVPGVPPFAAGIALSVVVLVVLGVPAMFELLGGVPSDVVSAPGSRPAALFNMELISLGFIAPASTKDLSN
jgi:hypothetical protein